MVRKAWMLSPAIAVHMGERFKEPAVHAEITRLVKLLPRAVIDVPEALQYLLGLELQRDALPAMRVSRAILCLFEIAGNADKLLPSRSGCLSGRLFHRSLL